MGNPIRIGLDAMGGDRAPQEVVAGALESLDGLDGDQLVLFGDEAVVRDCLGESSRWEGKISVSHAPEVVAMDEPPVEALRRKRKSSIALMAKAAARRELDVIISAGNTGAYVAVCQLRMRTLPGVLRPGIAVVFPTFLGPVVVCDVGANVAAKPNHLLQYAIMSSLYSTKVVGVENPRVGLISIGQEDAKGNELVKKANQLLRSDERINFIGNVEPRDFLKAPAEVIICDGFVGNVILKLTEGMAESLFKAIMQEIASQSAEMVATFRPVMDALYAKHDYNEYGGAPLLGIDGICIICHGNSDARAIKNSILRARQQVRLGINAQIVEELQGD